MAIQQSTPAFANLPYGSGGGLPYGQNGWRLPGRDAKTMYGHAIKSAREAAGLTQEQLAEAVGLSVSQINRFESQKREPRIGEIAALSRRLNVSPIVFFPDDLASATIPAEDALPAIEALLRIVLGKIAPDLDDPAPAARRAARVLMRVISSHGARLSNQDRAEMIGSEAERIAREFPQTGP